MHYTFKYFITIFKFFPQAVKLALKKLEEGGSIDDAKVVCEPDVLQQMYKWKVRFVFVDRLNTIFYKMDFPGSCFTFLGYSSKRIYWKLTFTFYRWFFLPFLELWVVIKMFFL